jgi:hypothetical protein
LEEEHCPRAAFFAYFLLLLAKSKLNEGIRLKKGKDAVCEAHK